MVYFGDSIHREFAPTITYGWIKKGENFEVKKNLGWRKGVNITVAVEINSIDVNARFYENINKNSVCEVLRLIRRNQNEKKIYFIFDGTASNRSKK